MPIPTKTKRKFSALLVAPALLLALSACTASPAPDPDNGQPPAGTMSASDWQVAYAGCMRDEGINMTDPGAGGDQGVNIDSSNQDAVMAAAQKCREKLGEKPPLSQQERDAQDAESRKAMLAAAACFRENGVDVADPKPGEGIKVPDTAPQDVQEECGAGGGVMGPTTPIGG